MYEYKSVAKYLSKQKEKFNFKKFLSKLLTRILICTVLLLVGLIVLKIDKNNKQIIYKFLYEKNINFAGINNFYKENFGEILPFENVIKENNTPVFNEKIKYTDSSIYKNGVRLTVEKNYLVPILESGVVVYIGKKDGFENTVVIQQVDGVDVWYGNIDTVNINLYDYVSKGEFLGETASDILYLLFQKEGKYLDYKEYLK